MDNWLMILLAFVIGYLFKNMCGKRVEGYGECTSFPHSCAAEACEGPGHDDQCNDWQQFLRDKKLTCQPGLLYMNNDGRVGDPYECR